MRTTYIAKEADIVKKWYVIDAEGVTLGRLASEVASIPVSYTHLRAHET